MHHKYIHNTYLQANKDIPVDCLNLESPKLVYYGKNKISEPIETIGSMPDVIVNDINNLIVTRPDKRSKNYDKLLDPLEAKKNKVKLKKKIRSKIHINDEDENLNRRYQGAGKKGKNLELSLMRPPKPLKKRAHTKDTVSSKNNVEKISIPSHTDEVLKNDNDHIKEIYIANPLSIQELSNLLSIPAPEIIKSLFLKGISVTINQVIDVSMAKSIASDYDLTVITEREEQVILTNQDLSDNHDMINDQVYQDRVPIVTIFGHVDHGKTTLMDTICQSHDGKQESGGITQAIIAKEVYLNHENKDQKIIFLDTPGHEAFSDMRIRSIQITDIAIVVVAADDGLQKQSIESINYLRKHKIPFLVAINKIDKNGANIQTLKQELANYDIIAEEWGGSIPIIEISALQAINIDKLLDTVIRMSNMQNLNANPLTQASGTVLDSCLDKKQGPMAKLLIQNGTIKVGDYVSNAQVIFKIRAIIDRLNKRIDAAGPSSIVNVFGMETILISGSAFKILKDEKSARKQLAEYQKNKDKNSRHYKKLNNRLTLDQSVNQGNNVKTKMINLILKTDSEGTIDAILNAFINIPQKKVQLNIIAAGVGQITVGDVNLAIVSNSTIISFNDYSSQIENLALQSNVTVANFKVIYDLLDYVQDLMIQLVDVEYNEQVIGKAMVENIFAVSKGIVAGCIVLSGKLKRGSQMKIIRNQHIVYSGEINSLKRLKEDVDEVLINNECGIMSTNFSAWEKKDIIEAYDLVEKDKML
uniref:Translation initiation factor IF-2, chloroplastic n=1 Tax=Helminthocladia australis TaxID=260093 RepID=A0A1G4NTT2_9FLOR|nr:Translation initiation factor 2 [Helminthocladia australis]SCW21966.1 Translation initiation factor 2 [Helminthocladia australis]